MGVANRVLWVLRPPPVKFNEQASNLYVGLVMVALCNRETIYIFMLWFVLLLFFPRLISAAADWMSTILRHIYQPDFIYLAALRLDKMTMAYK